MITPSISPARGLARLGGMGSFTCGTGWDPPSKGGSRSVATSGSVSRLGDADARRGRNGRARGGTSVSGDEPRRHGIFPVVSVFPIASQQIPMTSPPPDARLELSPQEMRAMGYRVVDLVVEHFAGLRDAPAHGVESRATL